MQERARRHSHSTCVAIQRKKSQSQSQQIVEPWFAQQQRVVVVSALQHSFRTSSLFFSFLDRQRDPNVTRTLGTSKGNNNCLGLLFCCKRWVAAGCCWYAADGIWLLSRYRSWRWLDPVYPLFVLHNTFEPRRDNMIQGKLLLLYWRRIWTQCCVSWDHLGTVYLVDIYSLRHHRAMPAACVHRAEDVWYHRRQGGPLCSRKKWESSQELGRKTVRHGSGINFKLRWGGKLPKWAPRCSEVVSSGRLSSTTTEGAVSCKHFSHNAKPWLAAAVSSSAGTLTISNPI